MLRAQGGFPIAQRQGAMSILPALCHHLTRLIVMEHWEKTYTSDVDIYEAFGAAFDPEGKVWRRVLETVPFAGKTVLEIGCGLGHYAQAIAPQTTDTTNRL